MLLLYQMQFKPADNFVASIRVFNVHALVHFSLNTCMKYLKLKSYSIFNTFPATFRVLLSVAFHSYVWRNKCVFNLQFLGTRYSKYFPWSDLRAGLLLLIFGGAWSRFACDVRAR